jgi:HAD superfamily hydrolase (TIGR01549 family)
MTLTHVIFDLDGTLVDSVDAHAEAWQRAFEAFGRTVPFPAVRQQIGKGGDQLMPVFLTDAEIDDIGESLEAFRGALFRKEYMSHVQPFPGAPALCARLADDGVRIAIASSASKDDLEPLVDRLGIRGFLDAHTDKDDVAVSKPAPDVFVEALRKLGQPPTSGVLVVGDSPWDAIAARRAGLRTIGVRAGGFDDADLRAAGCLEIYDDLEDLLRHYPWSPLTRTTDDRPSA